MRKVPNVNTHIFKQPGLPWQTASFSDAALAAFAKYDTLGDGLTDAEKTAMAAYIDAEVAAGNHAKKDAEVIFSLSGNNAKVDYIRGSVVSDISSPSYGLNGVSTTAGSTGVDVGYNPATDATKFTQNDAQVDLFVYSAIHNNTWACGAGVQTGINLYLTTQTRAYLNGSLRAVKGGTIAQKALCSLVRVSSTDLQYYESGVSVAANASATSLAPASANFVVGGFSVGLTAGSTGVYSMITIGASYADQTIRNSNVVTLLTALGLSL